MIIIRRPRVTSSPGREAVRYIYYSDLLIFQVMNDHVISTPCPELGEYIFALSVERHILYFLQSDTEIIIIRILSQYQDAGCYLNLQ